MMFKIQTTAICLRCREYLGIHRNSTNDCGCAPYTVPDTAVIYGNNIYRYIEISEEGQVTPYIYLGTCKEYGLRTKL